MKILGSPVQSLLAMGIKLEFFIVFILATHDQDLEIQCQDKVQDVGCTIKNQDK